MHFNAWPRALVVGSTAAALLVGCGSAGSRPTAEPLEPSGGATVAAPTASASPTVAVPNVRLDEELTLADGRSIKARCIGEGSPTIVLEAGGSNDMSDWPDRFVNKLGSTTTTCLYSRAGGPGSSAPLEHPRTMGGVTSDAFEVLALAKALAGVDGPYIFVGWSLGGSVAIAEALARPNQTVAVAILDTDFPSDFMQACSDDGRAVEDCQTEFDEDIEAKFMETEIARAVVPLQLPAVLVTAMKYPGCVDSPSATLSTNIAGTTVVAADCAGLATAIADKQIADWKAALPEVTQTRVEADHDGLAVSEGERISEQILAIVQEVRAAY